MLQTAHMVNVYLLKHLRKHPPPLCHPNSNNKLLLTVDTDIPHVRWNVCIILSMILTLCTKYGRPYMESNTIIS